MTGRLRFAEVGESDLSDLLEISLSHPEFLDLTEGPAGEHGHYDLEMLQRDWWLGTLEPGRRHSAYSTATPRRWRSGRGWAPSRWSIATTAAAWS